MKLFNMFAKTRMKAALVHAAQWTLQDVTARENKFGDRMLKWWHFLTPSVDEFTKELGCSLQIRLLLRLESSRMTETSGVYAACH